MKSRLGIVGAVSLLVGLVSTQLIVYAGQCYRRSGGNDNCVSQGGPNCSAIYPIGLPCGSEPLTAADCAALGLDIGDQCSGGTVVHNIPKDNSTDGNHPDGYLHQGNYQFTCTSSKSCTKNVVEPLPITVQCSVDPLVACTSYTVFTAGGGECPESSSQ